MDTADLTRFLALAEPLMVSGRDVMCILAGRTDSNVAKIKKIVKAFKLTSVVYHLNYNIKLMKQYGHFKRGRDLANSKSIELAFMIWKGKVPKTPKNRMHVDPGGSLFNKSVKGVPILAPRHDASVSWQVREQSLARMVGVADNQDADEKEQEAAVDEAAADAGLPQPGLDQPGETAKEAELDQARVAIQIKTEGV